MSRLSGDELSDTVNEIKLDLEASPPPITETNDVKSSTVGMMLHGAPTKEHRLLEYFLVISFGESLEVRKRTELMQVFEEHHYNQQQRHRSRQKHRRRKKRKKRNEIGSNKTTKVKKTVIKRVKRNEIEKYRSKMIDNSEINSKVLLQLNKEKKLNQRSHSAEAAAVTPVTGTEATEATEKTEKKNDDNNKDNNINDETLADQSGLHLNVDKQTVSHIITVTSPHTSHETTISDMSLNVNNSNNNDDFVDIEVEIEVEMPIQGSSKASSNESSDKVSKASSNDSHENNQNNENSEKNENIEKNDKNGDSGKNENNENDEKNKEESESASDVDNEREIRQEFAGHQTFVSITAPQSDNLGDTEKNEKNDKNAARDDVQESNDLFSKVVRVLSTPRFGSSTNDENHQNHQNNEKNNENDKSDKNDNNNNDDDDGHSSSENSVLVNENDENMKSNKRKGNNFELEQENLFATLRFKPTIVDRYPILDHQDTELIKTGTQLQHFCLPTGLFLTRYPSLPIFYTFVWTQLTGERLYGACLRFFETVDPSIIHQFCQNVSNREDDEISDEIDAELHQLTQNDLKNYFAPKCICIISYHPFIDAYRTFLTELYRLSLTPCKIPIERHLCNFFLETPLPPRGYFAVKYNIGDKSFRMARAPHNNPLSESPISSRVIFELFDIDTIMSIYRALLLEIKVLFVSTQYSILTHVTEVFRSLMYPFDWPHVYIPILPEDFLMFLRAPTVYIIGTHKSLIPSLDELPSDILVIDVNNGQARYTQDSTPNVTLPKHESKKLERFLQPVSDVLLGTKGQDFHQLDLAFPVAPTPDQIEQHEEMQQSKYQALKSMNNDNNNNNNNNNSSNNGNKTGKSKFSIWKSVKWGRKRNSDENTNKSNDSKSTNKHVKSQSVHMNAGFRSRDSIESPIRPRLQSMLRQAQSAENNDISGNSSNASSKSPGGHHKKNSSGDLSDITPLNAVFSDAAVRNGFLRFWVSLLRSYREFMIYPKGVKNTNLHSPYSPPMTHEYSVTSDSETATLNQIDESETMSTTYTKTNTITGTHSGAAMNREQSQPQFTHHSRNQSSYLKTPQKTPQTASLGPNNNKTEHSRATSYDSGLTATATAATAVSSSSAKQQVHGSSTQLRGGASSNVSIPTSIADLDPNAKLFDEEKFLKSFPAATKSFMKAFIKTEAFVRFVEKRLFDITGEDSEVRYFDEKIKEKLGRSRFAKAEATPFLDNSDYAIASEFAVPQPKTNDLNDRTFIYPQWPKLDASLFVDSSLNKQNGSSSSSHNNKQDKIDKSNFKMGNGNKKEKNEEESRTMTMGSIDASVSVNMMNDKNNSKSAPLSVGTSDDFSNDAANNPFFVDRVVYHLWFYIFIRTLQKGDVTTQKALHLMVKIITQMVNESIGLADHWVFVEMVEAMGRCGWGNQTIKLIEVMNELGFEPTDAIYSSLLSVLTQHFNDNLELAYNILGKLPKLKLNDKKKNGNNQTHNNNDNGDELRARRNSLLLNVNLKDQSKRKKFYQTIGELKNRFSKEFPGRSIVISEECPKCHEPMKDVHIRLGWTNKEHDYSTQCHVCNHRFDARFAIKEPVTYRVFLKTIDMKNDKPIKLFALRNEKGAYVRFSKIHNNHKKTMDDDNVGFQRAVTHESTNSMLLQLEQSTTSVASGNSAMDKNNSNKHDLKHDKNDDIDEVKFDRDMSISDSIQSGDCIININGIDTSGMSLEEIEALLTSPPQPSGDLAKEMELYLNNEREAQKEKEMESNGDGAAVVPASPSGHLKSPNQRNENESSVSYDPASEDSFYSDNDDNNYNHDSNNSNHNNSGNNNNNNNNNKATAKEKGKKKKKRRFMFGKAKEIESPKKAPEEAKLLCITLQRTIWCKYFSPVILYNEIRKVMQTHAAITRKKMEKDEKLKEKEQPLKDVMIQCGVNAISNSDFREKFPQLFWNLAWQLSNLRLPLHFLKNAFDDPKCEINLEPIEDLIEFLHISDNEDKDDQLRDLLASLNSNEKEKEKEANVSSIPSTIDEEHETNPTT